MIVAVRDDRMPGGRNSGAVYNLYKVSVHSLADQMYGSSWLALVLSSEVAAMIIDGSIQLSPVIPYLPF